MKKIILGAAAAAMTLASGSALAQPYYGDRGSYDQRYRDSDRDGVSDRREWNRDRDRDGRPDQYDRNDDRRSGAYRGDSYRGGPRYGANSYRGDGRWRQGQVYPHYRTRAYVIDDYRAYNLGPPRAGYRYYRSDNGDVVMAAIASGLIGLVIGGALNDNDHDRYDRGGYHYRR
jgi:Ni/Co efflux regulator RcnB